ncbi:Thioredoxin [Cognatiyoonia sediminum]|uniref:Thioredoxin n=1 Tax=Cognatiyoonia sediminum TaxID=1508389 RepID=A0A1M5QZK3_9RHOB|nr:thioredoxin family protein [Cognatiyoonia sediminum]SHH19555.1 Thioredoxin [Cognatiyoonia sediminum]
MDRRTFIATASAIALLPATANAIGLEYTPGLVKERLAAGETVFIDFAAHWCTTCRAQERVIGQLLGDNPAYEENITFVRVDWDQYGRGELATELNIPRRSTLVVLKGDEELGRLVARTSRGDIQGLLDTALNA